MSATTRRTPACTGVNTLDEPHDGVRLHPGAHLDVRRRAGLGLRVIGAYHLRPDWRQAKRNQELGAATRRCAAWPAGRSGRAGCGCARRLSYRARPMRRFNRLVPGPLARGSRPCAGCPSARRERRLTDGELQLARFQLEVIEVARIDQLENVKDVLAAQLGQTDLTSEPACRPSCPPTCP